ncbi:hypothetical protein HHL16_13630 [Pseudoflavitalea sp. G-6-1-2]|uniref:hypothetical protein n=1 Tax=Pseudoflavitalea sp. G-6-1-2 TaxID=2728841 RepID=UPI00146D0C2B|nr:hypothetical protein [Pseudoflavitalea sp. G-6-1-2]NML21924.1 hypothetical protein [Pseudoflavitalea sp. G-6-1-2]
MISFTPSGAILLGVFSLLFVHCSQQKAQKNIQLVKQIETVEFGGAYIFSDKTGNVLEKWGGKETIYFYDDMIMHQIPVLRSKSAFRPENGELVKVMDSVLPSSSSYVVFKADNDSIAFSYDSVQGPITDTISVEKFLSNNFRRFGKNFKDNSNQILISGDKNSNVITEKYIYQEKKDNSYPDTAYYTFRKDHNNLRFSISPSLDSLKKMKLVKLNLIFNPAPQGKDTSLRLERQITIEMEKKQVQDPALIIALFNRFAKDRAAYVPRKQNQ